MSEQASVPAVSRQTIGGFLRDLWRVVLFRPVRYGTLHLSDNAPSIAGITWGVALLYTITVVSILFANPLRAVSDLDSSVSSSSVLAVPTLLIPAVLCLLGISFGLLLAGTQRAPWWRRVLYLLVVWGALVSVVGICVGLGSSGALGATSVVLGFVVLGYCIVMWFARTRPAIDAVILVVLSTGILLVAYRSLVVQDLLGTTSGELITVSFILTQVASLALPLAFLSGVNATALGVSVVSWSGDDLGRRAARWIVVLLIVLALGWQWVTLLGQTLGGGSAFTLLGREGLSALALVIGCAAVWWLVHRGAGGERPAPGQVAGACVAVAVPVAYSVTSTTFIGSLLGALVAALVNVAPPAVVEFLTALLDLVTTSAFVTAVRILVIVGLIVGSVVLRRRGSRLLAAVAGLDALVLATVFGVPLVAPEWMWTPSALGNVGVLCATVLALVWTATRRWDRARATFVLVLALMSALIRQADFFAVPVGFLIGASAAALLIVGLVWGFLVDGGDAHADTPGFPRDRRLLALLGTFLFAITVVAWAVIGKDVGMTSALAATSSLALVTLGSALVIAVVLAAASPWLGRHGPATTDAQGVQPDVG